MSSPIDSTLLYLCRCELERKSKSKKACVSRADERRCNRLLAARTTCLRVAGVSVRVRVSVRVALAIATCGQTELKFVTSHCSNWSQATHTD